MPKIVSSVNLKGGVGKTALAVNFAAYAGRQGKRTLLVDLDPQTNATFSVIGVDAWKAHAESKGTVADLLGARSHVTATSQARTASDVLLSGVMSGVDLIPSHLDLFTIDLDLAAATARETKLQRALAPLLAHYDLIVCDCPPNLTLPTQNALALSSHYIVPISPDFLSSLGVALLTTRVRRLSEDLQHPVTLAGMVISRVGRPARHRDQTVAALRQQFGADVLAAEIHERVAVSEAAELHKPIFSMNDDSASAEFRAVGSELFTRLGL